RGGGGGGGGVAGDGRGGGGGVARLSGEAAQAGHRGGGLAQKHGQQGAGGAAADAQCLGGAGEGGLPVVVQDRGLSQPLPQAGQLGLRLGQALTPGRRGGPPRAGVEGGGGPVRLPVEGLAVGAAGPRQAGDVAAAAAQDGGGAGDPVRDG